jgi:hypothetical protein
MQVGVLPAAPLPDGVKVARRFVKPLVLVRVQVWQPILVESSKLRVERRAKIFSGSQPSTLNSQPFWKAGRYKLAAPVSKTGSAIAEVGALPTPSATLVESRGPRGESRMKACPALDSRPSTFDSSRPVAQKQSTRLITGRRRSVTCRDDQPSLSELRLGEPVSNPTLNERNPMKPVIRSQSQLLFRKSFKPDRTIRIRLAAKAILVFRPTRAGPRLKTV